MTSITYTVYNSNSGTEIGRGFTLVAAAQEKLSHDGAEYELRRDGDAWQLFVTAADRRHMTECYVGYPGHWKLAYAFVVSEAEAWEAIAKDVIFSDWGQPLEVMTDAAYDQMLAESAQ